MHIPHIDPNIVLWCTLFADIITVLAASTAAYGVIRLWQQKLKELAKKL